MFPLADRVQLVFERGALLPDPDGLLTGSGRQVRALEFTDEADVDPETVLEFLDHALDVGVPACAAADRSSDSASRQAFGLPGSPPAPS